MWMTMAATEVGSAPVRNDYSWAALYSIAWMFIGSFFALNLFVGVICDSFDKIKKEEDGRSATMTQEQQQWVDTMREAARQRPARGFHPPSFGPRRWLFDVVTSSAWDALITAIIVINVLLMACDYWRIEDDRHVYALWTSAIVV